MDGRTDGIAIASTALAMRALRRAVKLQAILLNNDVYLLNYIIKIKTSKNLKFDF